MSSQTKTSLKPEELTQVAITLLGETVLYQTIEGDMKVAKVTKVLDRKKGIVNLCVYPDSLQDDFQIVDAAQKGTAPGNWCFRPLEMLT